MTSFSYAASFWWFGMDNVPEILVKFFAKLFPYQKETLGKVSVLILMGRIRALNWVIWVGSDTWIGPDFQVRFYVTMFPDTTRFFLNKETIFFAWASISLR